MPSRRWTRSTATRRPSLGWDGRRQHRRGLLGDTLDREAEDLDEFTLGWSALHSQASLDHGAEEGDLTAPERHGRGFVRCGPDDAEDDDPSGAGIYDASLWERPAHPATGEADHI